MAQIIRQSPGAVLKDLLKEEELSVNALSIALGVPASRMSQIVKDRRSISADTAIRLGHYFGNGPEFWLRLQMRWDLHQIENREGEKIRAQVRLAS
ncbi:HigA family addiction module antitoxin [Dethiosulfatarculus sandiegensis]|uniref:XRE family transcriptional regulator n=1 Tax=Dethiosulfatarculus sandiegensis TaxID=1429043 RepID=A0A0D2JA82_9BACT|nr:HigA family addiction module antitoxin [Dethiosulfatarculus sandiegensis]KIX12641.1 XRE family transcriptional regulator [Dethiosulfatarculus sandiegensis]